MYTFFLVFIYYNGDYMKSFVCTYNKNISIDKFCVKCSGFVYNQYNYFHQRIDIIYGGRLKRTNKLILVLNEYGFSSDNLSDDQIIAVLYSLFKSECTDYLDGYFSFAVYDGNCIFAIRDQLGILPLYYYFEYNTLSVSNRIKHLLDLKEECIVDEDGVKELLGLGPSLSPGKTIYKDIMSLKPAHYIFYDGNVFKCECYWNVMKREHTDSYEETVSKIREMIIDETSFHLSDLDRPACFLSGGLDSSIICSIVSDTGKQFDTYSLLYEGQNEYFESNEYQMTQDDYYVDRMNAFLNNTHHNIVVSQEELYKYLYDAVEARDMPGMSDIDSSFYALVNKIDKDIILSGECADELFGGYPWFYKEELYNLEYFPWMRDLDKRLNFLNKNLRYLDIYRYIKNNFDLSNNKNLSIIKRTILLNYRWFMQTLLIRGETISNMLDKEIRMPFASKDLLQYVYNIPDDYFFKIGKEKSLLREAFKIDLPDEVLNRKKCPFPKTYNPYYTDLVVNELKTILENENSVLYRLFDSKQLNALVETKGSSFEYPWYGQLMKGPQFIAYLIQIDIWYKNYNIILEI